MNARSRGPKQSAEVAKLIQEMTQTDNTKAWASSRVNVRRAY
jgi:hypothetical protein